MIFSKTIKYLGVDTGIAFTAMRPNSQGEIK